MKPQSMQLDVERLVVSYLTDALEDEGCTVGVGVPEDWTVDSTTHLEVASDGTPLAVWPIVTYSTVRLVARSASTSDAKALCALGQGLLLAHPGTDDGIVNTHFLTGVLPARDPDTKAELAASTTRVGVRTAPIETGS